MATGKVTPGSSSISNSNGRASLVLDPIRSIAAYEAANTGVDQGFVARVHGVGLNWIVVAIAGIYNENAHWFLGVKISCSLNVRFCRFSLMPVYLNSSVSLVESTSSKSSQVKVSTVAMALPVDRL